MPSVSALALMASASLLAPDRPAVWTDLLPDQPSELQSQASANPKRYFVEFKGLKVTYSHLSKKDGVTTFTGGVVAQYGETVISTDELKVYELQHRAVSQGKTSIADPEADIACENLDIDYAMRTGTASHLLLRAAGVTVTADKVSISPGLWRLTDVSGTSSRKNHPTYRVTAKDVELAPGKAGTAHRIFLDIGTQPFGPLSQTSFNLDQRVTGLKIPDITNRRGVGLGLAWSSVVLVDDHSALLGSFGAFPKTSTSYGFQYAHSSLDPETAGQAIVPRSDLDEYLTDGYFNDIIVRSPQEEYDLLRGKRATWAVGTSLNAGTSGRDPDATDVSKLIEFAYDQGGQAGPFGLQTVIRAQRVRDTRDDPWIDRLNLRQTLGMPRIRMGRDLSFISRADFNGYQSKNGTSGFAIAEGGLTYEPMEGISMGVGAALGKNFGTADFVYDRLPFEKSTMIRVDYRRGFLTARGLWKYDLDNHHWYDREFELAFVADGIEPFVSSRTFPSDFRIGIRFRLEDFVGKLLQRNIKRQLPAKSTGG